MTLVVQPVLLPGRTMRERDMVVCNIVEEVNLVLLKKQTSSNRVDWSIAPSFVEESAILVELVEVIGIGLRS